MKNNYVKKETPQYKKAIKLDSKFGVGGLSMSHTPAMIIPLLIGTFMLTLGAPIITAIILTAWVFCAFLFVIKDKPERFIRRILGSRKKHWSRKLSRSKSLFTK